MVDTTKAATDNKVKTGLIRFEAIIPLAIVLGITMLYFIFFFDLHLRRGIEYGATIANGAEVNIGRLNTSVFNASVEIENIAMTNPETPARNRVQIGSVKFRMLWDALLRGKVVIDEASINDVQIDTERKSAGRVLPVKEAKDGDGVTDKLFAQLKEEFSGNVVGDLAAIAGGVKPQDQLSSIGSDTKSSAYLTEMQKSLDDKSKQWQSRVAAMPKAEEFSALQTRLTNVKLDNVQDVAQIQASLKELESIRNDFDAKSKLVTETASAVNLETSASRSAYADLDKIIKEDVRSLQAKMHLPSLDSQTLSRALFGMDVLGKMQQARHYMDQSRSYMPVKSDNKDDKKKDLLVNKRAKGQDYVFGQPRSYPPFWLRKAVISSSDVKSGSDISGEILDVTTNQAMIGRPMVATLKGNSPQQGVYGLKASLIIDHTTSLPLEKLLLDVGKYSVAGRSLVSNPGVELGFSKADSALKLSAELKGDNVDVQLSNQFTRVEFETKAESEVVREMMTASVAGLNTVNLNAHVSGTWSALNWQLSSNLADSMVNGMQRYLQGKMDESRKRIEALVNDKIKDQRERLYAQQGEIEATLKSTMASRQAQIDNIRKQIDDARNKLESRKNSLVNEQQQKIKQEGGKVLDNLFKKF